MFYSLLPVIPIRICFIFPVYVLIPCDSLAANFTVTNSVDSGTGSRHEAIEMANSTANLGPFPDRIEFDIPGAGVHTSTPLSFLPVVTEPVIIDGYTQGHGTTEGEGDSLSV